jgi:DNA polymerase (family 10)
MKNVPKSASEAAALLLEIRRLMELKGENPFKVRAFDKAADALAGREDLGELARAGRLTEIPGVGKGIAEVLGEFVLKGTSRVRDELLGELPAGLLELTEIPGLGPKKAMQLIEELDIHSVRELEYACRENRLLRLKGFGDKIQSKILEGIRFLSQTAGQQRLGDVLGAALELLEALRGELGQVSDAGMLRRRLETLSRLDYLVAAEDAQQAQAGRKAKAVAERFRKKHLNLPEIAIHLSSPRRFGYELARLTGTDEHWRALGSPESFDAASEREFFDRLKLPLIPPESRETGEEVRLARAGHFDALLAENGVQGVFHNHTVRSDGNASLEQMVIAAKKLGYKYIGISDHSQSAFYAQGLKTPTLKDQEKEVRQVQERHPEIRVFWGIESDILQDGSLDYEPAVLKRFDFVVASIHSRFKMEKEAMTDRVLEALRNPCTRFLGHATGRLLLGRKGYDLHMEKVIQEAARRDVAIEINANPARLDIDWRWGPQLRESGTLVSINPDAHATEELENTHFGVTMARKALLPTSLVVNARSVQEVERWLRRA